MARKSNKVGLGHPPLSESSIVRLSVDGTLEDGRTRPAEATGVVVFVHAAGEAYEVEFVTPSRAGATVMASSLPQAE